MEVIKFGLFNVLYWVVVCECEEICLNLMNLYKFKDSYLLIYFRGNSKKFFKYFICVNYWYMCMEGYYF